MKEKINNTKLMDLANVERPKCKCCGEDILYYDTDIHFSHLDKNKLIFKGHSYKTTKVVNGVEYHLKVCEKCLREKFPQITNMLRTFNVMSEITKFAFDIPQDVFEQSRAKYSMSKDAMVKKYGEKEGLAIWEKYCKRQAETNTFEYKQKKYGMTKQEFKEYNKSRAVTEKNMIKKYGEEVGRQKFQEYVEKQKLTKSWEYMVEKFGEDKAREINRSKLLILENFINKYGEKDGTMRYNLWLKNKNNGYSIISQKFFNELDVYISKKYETFYATKNKEAMFFIKNIHSNCSLDYYIPELKLCIEFNGSCYHGDSRVFRDDEICNPFDNMTAKQLREKDAKRYDALLNEYGIKTVVVWELDYKNGIDIPQFIKNELNITI